VTKNNSSVEGPDGLVCTARLPLSSATLNWLADLIRGHLKNLGSRWRVLPAGKIVTIVLAVLRCDQRSVEDDAARGRPFCRALSRICGCHRFFTSRSWRAARSGRGFLIWSLTYRSTVR